MRYVKGHGLHTRNRIVEEASYGLRQAGANGISVSDLMKLAGLTHGGFYAYFESREALIIEAFAAAMDRTIAQWRNHTNGMPAEERFSALVAIYLRSGHRDDCARGCVLPALGTDIARSSPKARRAFASKLDEMIDVIAGLLPGKVPKQARQIATSALATMMVRSHSRVRLATRTCPTKFLKPDGRLSAVNPQDEKRRSRPMSRDRTIPSRRTIMTEHVKTEIDAGILTLTLARADKKNALSNVMYSAMSDGLDARRRTRLSAWSCFRVRATVLRLAMTWPISAPRPAAGRASGPSVHQ